MTKNKQYKVLRLTVANKDALGIEKLIAELSEIEIQNIEGLSYAPYIFSPDNWEYFIFLASSTISNQIISNPEAIVNLNLDEFEIQEFQIDDTIVNKAYFHTEYLKSKNNSLKVSEINIDYSLQNCIDDCILKYHTDMYFTYIIRLIYNSEYEANENDKSINIEDVFLKYKKLCSYILFETCNIQIPEYSDITYENEQIYQQLYQDVIKYGQLYLNVISTYVQYRESVRKIIMTELNDKEPTYPLFYQLCMMEGYKIALSRTEKNLNNKDYFSHELIEAKNCKVIKLFPTPFGFQNKGYLVNLIKIGQIETTLDDYFKKFNIIRITEEHIKEELMTKYIFKVPNELGVFYYKRRPMDDEYVPFGEQDRKNPFKSLLVQGQINLTQKI